MEKELTEIMSGTFRQLHNYSEDTYATMERELQQIMLTKSRLYSLDFPIRPFNNKLRYITAIINNYLTAFANEKIQEMVDVPETIDYVLMTLDRRLSDSLKKIQKVIIRKELYVEKATEKYVSYSSNPEYYENIYIYNYLQQAFMMYALEIQSSVVDKVQEKDRLSLERIYAEKLQMPMPEKLYISEVEVLSNAGNDLEIPMDYETEPTLVKTFVNTVKDFGFFELPKVKSLKDNEKRKLLKMMLSNRIPYYIAMIDFLGYFTHLRQEYGMSKTKIFRHLSVAFNNESENSIKANYYALQKESTVDRNKYTSYKHTEDVKNYYDLLLHN